MTFVAKLDCLDTSDAFWASKNLSDDDVTREEFSLQKEKSTLSCFDLEREEGSVGAQDDLFGVVKDDECKDNCVIFTPEWGGPPGIGTCRSSEGTFCGDHKKGLQGNDNLKEKEAFEEVQVTKRDVTLKILKDDGFLGVNERNLGLKATEMPHQFQGVCWSDLGMSKVARTGFFRLGKGFGSLRRQIYGNGSLKE